MARGSNVEFFTGLGIPAEILDNLTKNLQTYKPRLLKLGRDFSYLSNKVTA